MTTPMPDRVGKVTTCVVDALAGLEESARTLIGLELMRLSGAELLLTRERDEARAEVERLRKAAVKLMGHKPWKWVHDEDGSPLQAWAHDDPPDELLIAWLRLRDLANGEAKEAADG